MACTFTVSNASAEVMAEQPDVELDTITLYTYPFLSISGLKTVSVAEVVPEYSGPSETLVKLPPPLLLTCH